MRLARKAGSRRGRSDTLGRSGFTPLIGWILNSGHQQTTIPLSPCFFGHDDWNMYPTKSNIPTKCKTGTWREFGARFSQKMYVIYISDRKKTMDIYYVLSKFHVAYACLSINSYATCVLIIHKHGYKIITRLFNNNILHEVQAIPPHTLKFHFVKLYKSASS